MLLKYLPFLFEGFFGLGIRLFFLSNSWLCGFELVNKFFCTFLYLNKFIIH